MWVYLLWKICILGVAALTVQHGLLALIYEPN